MNIIKKFFPHYESKREMKDRMEREIAFLNGMRSTPILTVEMDISKVRAIATFDECGMPTEMLKREIRSKMVDLIEPFVEYDLKDATEYRAKMLVGTLYVAIRKPSQSGGPGE